MSAIGPLKEIVATAMPWKWEVMILQGGTPEQVRKHVKKYADIESELESWALGHCWVHIDKPVVVWVRTIADVPALVHELMHAVFGMLEARGMKHNDGSEEAYTYTVEDLLRRILGAKKWRAV